MLTPLLEQTVVPYLADPHELITLGETETLATAAGRLADGVPGLIVVDAAGMATGLVTAADLLAAAAEPRTPFVRRPLAVIRRPVADYVAPHDPVLDAIQLMRLRKLACLPVLEAGRAVALVSMASVCEALARAVEGEFRRAEADMFGRPADPEEPNGAD